MARNYKYHGRLIKKLREESGVTQVELAELLGCSKYNIIKIEKNQYAPNLALFLDIMEILGVQSLDTFLKNRTNGKTEDIWDFGVGLVS